MFEKNPFSAFSAHQISSAIDLLPPFYGYLNQSGIFRIKGVPSRAVLIDEREGQFRISSAKPVGSAGQGVEGNSRRVRSFAVPHFPHDNHVSPEDVNGLRAFGGNIQESVTSYLNDRLAQHKRKHEITLEYLLIGAMKGQIVDGSGTILTDLWSEYGVTAQTLSFALGTATTKVRSKCMSLIRSIEDGLMGDTMSGVEVLCSPEFFDALTEHDSVKAAYQNTESAPSMLGNDLRTTGFKFGGCTFKEYRATAPNATGVATRFIDAGKARAYPVGTMDTFNLYAAPADFNETVGKLGQLYYAKVEEAKMGRGYDIHSQFNPLPICTRPKVLFELTI